MKKWPNHRTFVLVKSEKSKSEKEKKESGLTFEVSDNTIKRQNLQNKN